MVKGTERGEKASTISDEYCLYAVGERLEQLT